jgi:hypothetical protein
MFVFKVADGHFLIIYFKHSNMTVVMKRVSSAFAGASRDPLQCQLLVLEKQRPENYVKRTIRVFGVKVATKLFEVRHRVHSVKEDAHGCVDGVVLW